MSFRELEEQERKLPLPVTSFDWQQPGPLGGEWIPEVEAVQDYLHDKARKVPSPIDDYYRCAFHAFRLCVSRTAPTQSHIIRSRILDWLERRMPGSDDFHAEVMSRLNEALYTVFKRERLGRQ